MKLLGNCGKLHTLQTSNHDSNSPTVQVQEFVRLEDKRADMSDGRIHVGSTLSAPSPMYSQQL